MKNYATFFTDLALCAVLIPALFFCLITSFDISVNPATFLISSTVFCIVYALLAKLVKSGSVLWLSVAVTMIVFIFTLLFSLDYILAQTSYAVNQILSEYSLYLPVPNSIKLGTQTANYATGFFVFASVIYSAAFTLSLIRAKKIFVIVGLSVLTLIPCFILVNTLPNVFFLLIVLVVLFALYITRGMRKANPAQSGGFTVLASTVIAIMLAVVLALNPIESYKRFEWQNNALDALESITGLKNKKENSLAKQLESIKDSLEDKNLGDISQISQTHTNVMQVFSRNEGNIYLKGVAYADYSDNNWSILSENELKNFPENLDAFCITKGNSETTAGLQTKIKMKKPESFLYSPYFVSEIPSDATALGDICINNDTKLSSYSFSHYGYSPVLYSDGCYSISANEKEAERYRNFVYDTYLKIPDSTRIELFKIAVNNGIAALGKSEIPQAVKEFVSSSAEYSLDTPQMPEGKDFPVWFLSECDTGYCVHFAASATLMLRSLGVPARYVTGYYANVSANVWSQVTSDNAHAWVEFYDDEAGWIPLECTPSSFTPSPNSSIEDTQITSSEPETNHPPTTTAPTTTTNPKDEAPSATVNNNVNNAVNGSYSVLIMILISVAALALTALIIFFRRIIILKRRTASFERESNRLRIINMYRYLIMFERYSQSVIPDRILNICEKARFSRHSMSDSEVQTVSEFIYNSKSELYNSAGTFKKLYLKFIKCII